MFPKFGLQSFLKDGTSIFPKDRTSNLPYVGTSIFAKKYSDDRIKR